ncbi:ciliary microtubule-associated protein 3 isoform X1 [Oncorhynchus nerka]|uniref:ciliary microtubule-associated protein 3 isoform X1 n=1 Tax=Oncorhynchus nerka TaxID=8023 RepID=UPI001132861A|nr:protein pitchfork isoform X1 [Oncorhynchus nerka]XP_046221926.1 protein pitchfork-like isoform X1 [Oncorhynchus gorbuscha]
MSNLISEFIAPLRCVAFGSCQERKLFPTHCAPNRLGNKLSLEGAPHRGPGCYDNHVGTILYDVQKRPESKKGYTLAARTSARFLPCAQTITPSPQRYQQDRTWSKVYPPGRIPFSSTTKRFRTKPVTADFKPGPGTYAHDTTLNQKVSWPMKFGSPDWGRLPTLERKALRTELLCDKEFVKQRSRVAYLQLFYS